MKLDKNNFMRLSEVFKKGQEEIVGFIVIVVLVVIIGLVLLGLNLGGEKKSTIESTEASHLLDGLMEFTSDCKIGISYRPVGELFEDCYSGMLCEDGFEACEVLNKTLVGIFESGLRVGGGRPLEGFEFVSNYVLDDSDEEIIRLIEGNCTGKILGASRVRPAFPGKIEVRLRLCL